MTMPVVEVMTEKETGVSFRMPWEVMPTVSPLSVNVTAWVSLMPVPVTSMPVAKDDVSARVTTADPAVVPDDVLEMGMLPGLVVVVIVWAAAAIPRFVKIVSIAVRESLAEAYEIVNFPPVIRLEARLRQEVNIVTKRPVVTPEATKAGTEVREGQVENMLDMLVTMAVLNRGTVVREEQLLNMLDMLVTMAVLNRGTVVREEQLLNMPPMLVTEAVLNRGTEVREEQLPNMLDMLVTMAVLNRGTEVREKQLENMLAMLVTEAVLNRGTDWRE